MIKDLVSLVNCAADGHPKYVEQDKFTGNPFVERQGAQIRFCKEMESWVFMHPEIETSNECNWLLRSKQVDPDTDFDVIAASSNPWTAWTGDAVFGAEVNIKCTSCQDESDCSYQGKCES